MKKWWMLMGALLIIIVLGVLALIFIPGPKEVQAPTDGVATTTPANALSDLITVASPSDNAKVDSPLTITGSARGNWYFEASFPIELTDASGKVIAQGVGQAQSDWMTTSFVPFKATLNFPPQPAGSHGTLILSNDNPSGDPAKQKEVDIPVIF